MPYLLPGARTGETTFPSSCFLVISPDLADCCFLLALGDHCVMSNVRTVSFKGSSMMFLLVKFSPNVSGSWCSLFGGSVISQFFAFSFQC